MDIPVSYYFIQELLLIIFVMIIMSPDSPDASSRFLDADLLKAVKSIIRIESGQSRSSC